MFDLDVQYVAANGIIRAAQVNFQLIMEEQTRPSALYRPRIFVDGDKWCALYGENVQDGVAGFGDTPAAAMRNFDQHWNSEKAGP